MFNFFWQKYTHFSQQTFEVKKIKACNLIGILEIYDFEIKFHSKWIKVIKYFMIWKTCI
jgi:hypothetical protein